jgi:hypothetical protein
MAVMMFPPAVRGTGFSARACATSAKFNAGMPQEIKQHWGAARGLVPASPQFVATTESALHFKWLRLVRESQPEKMPIFPKALTQNQAASPAIA